jgi:hypothetical protein
LLKSAPSYREHRPGPFFTSGRVLPRSNSEEVKL